MAKPKLPKNLLEKPLPRRLEKLAPKAPSKPPAARKRRAKSHRQPARDGSAPESSPQPPGTATSACACTA